MTSRVLASGVIAVAVNVALAPAAVRAEAPKNVILFVGDGMGAEQVKAAGFYFNGASGLFNFEQFTHSAWMTHNNSVTGRPVEQLRVAAALRQHRRLAMGLQRERDRGAAAAAGGDVRAGAVRVAPLAALAAGVLARRRPRRP